MTDVEFDDDFADIDPGDVKSSTTLRTSRTGIKRPSSGRKPSAKRLGDLQAKLSSQMFQAGAVIGFGLPVTGYFISQESDNFTNAITQLAAKKVEWVKALEQVADIQPGITIGRCVLGIGVALSVDRRSEALEYRSPRFQRIAAFMGVAAAYHAVYESRGDSADYANGGGFSPPPGQFVPVS